MEQAHQFDEVNPFVKMFISKKHLEVSDKIRELKDEVVAIREAVGIKDLAAKVTDDAIYFAGCARGYAERKHRNHKFELYDSRFGEGSIIETHSHNEDEIFIIIRGLVIITVDGVRSELKTGGYAIIKPGVEHSLEFIEDSRIMTVVIPPLAEFMPNAKSE